ncbi:MAG: hypothetical protein QM500_09445 [Methylococcales bacterium]
MSDKLENNYEKPEAAPDKRKEGGDYSTRELTEKEWAEVVNEPYKGMQ